MAQESAGRLPTNKPPPTGSNATRPNIPVMWGSYNKATHEGCTPCPRNFQPKYKFTWHIPANASTTYFSTTHFNNVATQIEVLKGMPLTYGGVSGQLVRFLIKDMKNRDTDNMKHFGTGGGYELGEIIIKGHSKKCDTVVYSKEPLDKTQRMSEIGNTAQALVAKLDQLLPTAQYGIDIKLRSVKEGRYNWASKVDATNRNVPLTPECTSNPYASDDKVQPYAVAREPFWSTPEGEPYFYDFLHDW